MSCFLDLSTDSLRAGVTAHCTRKLRITSIPTCCAIMVIGHNYQQSLANKWMSKQARSFGRKWMKRWFIYDIELFSIPLGRNQEFLFCLHILFVTCSPSRCNILSLSLTAYDVNMVVGLHTIVKPRDEYAAKRRVNIIPADYYVCANNIEPLQ